MGFVLHINNMKKVIVTGTEGVIGLNLMNELNKLGYTAAIKELEKYE